MTPQEQAELLVHALRRVLTDLDTIADGTLDALDPRSWSDEVDELEEYSAPRVGTIRFEPDEGSVAPAINIDVIRGSRRRAQVADVLRRIEEEIDS